MKPTKNNTCAGCKRHIDRSSTSEFWITVKRSSFWGKDNEEVKSEKILLCSKCGMPALNEAREMEKTGHGIDHR